jgi:hypothetical protein
LTPIKNVFACSKHSNFENGQSLFFSNVVFSTKCAPFFLKIGEDLTLIIKKEKGLELMKIISITYLSTFGSKMFLTLKIMKFENVTLTKVVYIYIIEGMNV